jgi:Transcription initiation factor IID, 18kD subunit
MMFIAGETAELSAETTWTIEEIVREQVVEMVSRQGNDWHHLTWPS